MKLVPIALVALSMALPSCISNYPAPGLQLVVKDRNDEAIPNVEITVATDLLLLDGSFLHWCVPFEEPFLASRFVDNSVDHEKFSELPHRATLLTDAEGRAWIAWDPPKPNSFLRNLATLWRNPKVGTVVIEYTTPDGTRTRQEIYVNSWSWNGGGSDSRYIPYSKR